MAQPLVLVRLTEAQIALAKAANGPRRAISHAVVCGDFGQLFGTEKQCRKYFDTWRKIFAHLFSGSFEAESFEIRSFETTFDLVNLLGEADAAPRRLKIRAMLAELEDPPRRFPVRPVALCAVLAAAAWWACQ